MSLSFKILLFAFFFYGSIPYLAADENKTKEEDGPFYYYACSPKGIVQSRISWNWNPISNWVSRCVSENSIKQIAGHATDFYSARDKCTKEYGGYLPVFENPGNLTAQLDWVKNNKPAGALSDGKVWVGLWKEKGSEKLHASNGSVVSSFDNGFKAQQSLTGDKLCVLMDINNPTKVWEAANCAALHDWYCVSNKVSAKGWFTVLIIIVVICCLITLCCCVGCCFCWGAALLASIRACFGR